MKLLAIYPPDDKDCAILIKKLLHTAPLDRTLTTDQQADDVGQVLVIGQGCSEIPQELMNKAVFMDKLLLAQAVNPWQLISDAFSEQRDEQKDEQKGEPITKTKSSPSLSFVAVTACPTGVAHTFMAAKALEMVAKELGFDIKVETQGSVGAKNTLTDEEIALADVVILATDIEVDTSRFVGKKIYHTSTKTALRQTKEVFSCATLEAKVETPKTTKPTQKNTLGFDIYKHLMTGVSYMLPLVVAGGLIIALSFMFGIEAFQDGSLYGGLPKALMDIGGGSAFALMIAVFSGYVAYSIADRPGLAVGLIGGMLANTAGAGILGGIVAGFLAGYTVKWLNQTIKLPDGLSALKPILILPLLGALVVGLLMIYLINPPVVALMTALTAQLSLMGEVNAVLLGLVIGAMMCVDMGGPINKAAYTFSVGLIVSGVYTPMAAAMAAGMVPPIGMAIATWVGKHKFDESQKNAGKASFVLGLCFISEGALPFVAADPVRVIASSVVGGAVAGAMSLGFGIALQAPHGGLFVIPFVSKPVLYLIAIATGSVVTGVLYAFLKPKMIRV